MRRDSPSSHQSEHVIQIFEYIRSITVNTISTDDITPTIRMVLARDSGLTKFGVTPGGGGRAGIVAAGSMAKVDRLLLPPLSHRKKGRCAVVCRNPDESDLPLSSSPMPWSPRVVCTMPQHPISKDQPLLHDTSISRPVVASERLLTAANCVPLVRHATRSLQVIGALQTVETEALALRS